MRAVMLMLTAVIVVMHSAEFAFEYDVQTDVLEPLEFQVLIYL